MVRKRVSTFAPPKRNTEKEREREKPGTRSQIDILRRSNKGARKLDD